MRVFEHVDDIVQPIGLGATLICLGAATLGVVGAAITSPVQSFVLAVAFLASWIGFPQRSVRVGLPTPLLVDDRGPAFATMKWACLTSTGFSFVVGSLGHAQLLRHGCTLPPVVLSGAVALLCAAVTLLVAARTRGIAELATRYR